MAPSGHFYDLVIVGGGITGAGVARDAALRGLKVALFEKWDFGSGTSSRSSKLIHGGLRYLEHGEVGLVFESVSERYVQSRVGPHLVRPLPFLVPIYRGARWGVNMMSIGLWIYDALAMFRAPRIHKTYRGQRAHALVPYCKSEDLRGVIEYYDCYTDDARLVLENVLDAAQIGARCESYHEVLALGRQADQVRSVTVRNRLTGKEETVTTRCVVMATGPWTDELCKPLGLDFERPLLRRTKGVHLVFLRDKMPIDRAITMLSPIDGRVMFAIPWRDRLVLGTTDTDFTGATEEVWADRSDADYLCESANRFFSGVHFTPEEAIATWAGLRPLVDERGENASAVSREHEIIVREEGVILIAGGKLTTYRIMAREVVDQAVSWLGRHHEEYTRPELARSRTRKRRLPGAANLTEAGWRGIESLARSVADGASVPEKSAAHLAWTYGSRCQAILDLCKKDAELARLMVEDLPFIWAEVPFAATHDRAQTLVDVLVRRIPLALVDREQGLRVADRAATLLGAALGWNETRHKEELSRYREYVQRTRQFRHAEQNRASG